MMTSHSYDLSSVTSVTTAPLPLVPATAQEAAFFGANASVPYPLYNNLPAPYMPYDPYWLPDDQQAMSSLETRRKRRRVITRDQRKAANVRERRRMCHLNEAFDDLRQRVPTFAYEKKLSRIETLKLAVSYIQFMSEMLTDLKPQQNSDSENMSPVTSSTGSGQLTSTMSDALSAFGINSQSESFSAFLQSSNFVQTTQTFADELSSSSKENLICIS